jgi:hypothetical protein
MTRNQEQRLEELSKMSPAQLRALWRECWRRPAPAVAPDLLRRGIAWKIQSQSDGVLSANTKRALELAAARLRRGEQLTSGKSIHLKAGTRLVREWRGKTHQVVVLEKGYEHEGKHFTSLTQVASTIAGTRWSGPLFFGLKKPRVPSCKTAL